MNEAGEGQAVELVVVAPPGAPMLDASVQRLRELLVDNTDRLPGGWRLSVVDDPAAHVPSPGVALTAFVHPAPDAELAQLVAPLFEHAAPSPAPSTAWTTRLMGRRTALAALGGLGLATIAAACGGGSSNGASNTSKQSAGGTTPTTGESTSSSATSTTAGTTGVVLAPEMTEGPYYLDLNLVRSDITEDRTGAAFALTLRVVDVSTSSPVKGASVDIWHADANGLYSGFVSASAGANGSSSSSDDGTFLRGTQVSNADGNVTFKTIYPGWYRGRAVHIHVKVHVSGKVVHTGQLFFDDSFTDTVYASTAPYAARSTRNTRNANDSIYSGGGSKSTLDVTKGGNTYAATLAMGIKTS